MSECAKTKLTYSNVEFQNFSGRGPRAPPGRGGKDQRRERKGGEGKGGERIGKGRNGRREAPKTIIRHWCSLPLAMQLASVRTHTAVESV